MSNLHLFPFALLVAAACGPSNTVPAGATHPANPAAPTAPIAKTAEPEPDVVEAQPHHHPAELPASGDTAPPDHGPTVVADDKATLAAAEQAAYEKARPVFEKYCANCHSSSGKKANKKKLKHFNMDTYPFGGHHAGEMGEEIREVLGATGEEASMPKDKPGSVKGEELDLIIAWSKAFDAAHKAGAH